MTRHRFTLLLLTLVPALYQCVVVSETGQWQLLLLLSSVLFTGWPHLLVCGLGWWSASRRGAAIATLIALDVLFLAFQLWVMTEVPARESGIAWVLYAPLAVIVLLAAWLAICAARRIPRSASSLER